MIPVGLRRRPQFLDLLQEIQIDPNKIKYPNRDAKRLRNGFVYSQYDEENNRQMLMQQMQLNTNLLKDISQRMREAMFIDMSDIPIYTPSLGPQDISMSGLSPIPHLPDFEQPGQSSAAAAASSSLSQAQQQQEAASSSAAAAHAAIAIQQAYRKRKAHEASLSVIFDNFEKMDENTKDIKIDTKMKTISVYKQKGGLTKLDAKQMIGLYNMKNPKDMIKIDKIDPPGKDRNKFRNAYVKALKDKGYKIIPLNANLQVIQID